MSKLNLDGYSNAVIGGRDVDMRIRSASAPFLYARGGLFARVIDKPAETATAGMICSDMAINDALDSLKAVKHVTDCLRWSMLKGGAAIIPIVNDGGDLDSEINYNNISEIEELRVYDVDQFSVWGNKYSDPTKSNYGKPQFYEVDDFIVHESRVIVMSGDAVPPSVSSGLYWHGRNIADAAYKSILDYRQTIEHSRNILQRKQQAIYRMAGLSDMIQAGSEEVVQKRINLVDQARSILNTVVIDDEDNFNIADSNLGGIEKVIAEHQVQLSADTGIPVSVLFGRSPSGLNSTGEMDMRNWYDLVEGARESKIKPLMERLISLIAASKSVKAGDHWQLEFEPLFKPSAKEKAEIAEQEAKALQIEMQAMQTAFDMGAISEEEVTQHMQEKGLFGLSADTESGADYAKATA